MRQITHSYVCDGCGGSVKAPTVPQPDRPGSEIPVTPEGWLVVRLEFRKNKGKWDACSVACAQEIVEREAASVQSVPAVEEEYVGTDL